MFNKVQPRSDGREWSTKEKVIRFFMVRPHTEEGRLIRPMQRRADATWGVAATVKEPLDIIVPFACHHLAQGASSVTLYLDDPKDPAAQALRKIKGVRVVLCDQKHWQKWGPMGQRPMLNARQLTNILHALRYTRHDWLLHLDADEYLLQPEPLGTSFAQVPLDKDWLAIPMLERIWADKPDGALFGGIFRAPIHEKDVLHEIYGDEAPLLYPRGFSGASRFRPAMPRGTPYSPGIHDLLDRPGPKTRPFVRADKARLMHFEAISPVHWALKQLRYAAMAEDKVIIRPARFKAVKQIIEADDVKAAAFERFERTYVLDARQRAIMEAHDALVSPDLRIKDAVAAFAPHVTLDFSTERLDAALMPEVDRLSADVARRRDALLAVPHPFEAIRAQREQDQAEADLDD